MSSLDADFINTCYPIVAVKKYKNGCYEIIRKSELQDNYLPEGGNKIMSFSKRSLAKLIWTVNATEIKFGSMITLTYPNQFPVNGATVKEDLRTYLQWLKREFDTEYLWFLEFQKRGAPHFHILVEQNSLSPYARMSAGLKWTHRVIEADWFKACFREYRNGKAVEIDYQDYRAECLKIAKFNTHDTFWEVAKSQNGLNNYAAKYASKMYQKKVPEKYTEVGRFWGASQGVKPKPEVLLDTCEEDIRILLERMGHKMSDAEVIPKLLFNVKEKDKKNVTTNNIRTFDSVSTGA